MHWGEGCKMHSARKTRGILSVTFTTNPKKTKQSVDQDLKGV